MGLTGHAGEALLVVWFQAIGMAGVLAARFRSDTLGAVVLGLPVGIALFVVTAFVVVQARVPAALPVTVVLLSAAAVAATVRARRRIGPAGWVAGVGAPAGVGLLSLVFSSVALTRLSPDSFRYVELAGIVAREHTFEAAPNWLLQQRPLFVPLLNAPATWLGSDYLSSIMPVLAVSAAAAVVWLGRLCLAETDAGPVARTVVPLLGLVVLLASDRFLYHAFYVNGHLAFATYALTLTAGAWLERQRPGQGWAGLAALSGAALALLRPEASLFLVLALVPVLVDRALPWPTRALVTLPAVAVAASFAGLVLLPTLPAGATFDAATHGSLAIAAGLAVLLAAVRVPVVGDLARAGPVALVVLLAVPVAIAAVVAPERVTTAVEPFWLNLTGDGLWRATFLVLPLSALLVALVAPLRQAAYWLTPVVGFWVMLLLLGVVRDGGYRVGVGDSGNRMLMHTLLVTVTYVVVAAGSGLRRVPIGRHAAPLRVGARNGHKSARSASKSRAPSLSTNTWRGA